MIRSIGGLAAVALVLAGGFTPASGQDCENQYDSTFELIQAAVFERNGCTNEACHGATTAAGGLDLSPDVAYDNLIDRDVTSVDLSAWHGAKRVVPGQKDSSLLWFNLAAATLPDQWDAPLRGMPLARPPISLAELEAVRLWIEHGAPRDGVVPETGELLDACLPEPEPIRITPLPPPDPDKGLQLRMPTYTLPPNSEDEVCFVSYYDVTDQVPPQFLGAGGDTFRYVRNQIRQNPGSHHLIVNLYDGDTPIEDPIWGEFTCKGGADDGQPCAPRDLQACAGGGLCGSDPVTAFACTGYGPADAFTASSPFTGTQEASASINFPDGVYNEVPTRGIIIWNSHAFNPTSEPGPIEVWMNFEYADRPENRAGVIFDVSNIFKMKAAPFESDEVCQHYTLPRNGRLFELSSHMHRHGKRFQIFEGNFACNGGANDGDPCTPLGLDPEFGAPDVCAGALCEAHLPPEIGDCNGNLVVAVNELVLGVGMALGTSPVAKCRAFDRDGDAVVSVSELVAAVREALNPKLRDAQDSLVYTSFVYDDPIVLRFDPPIEFPPTTAREGRRLTYCALYDNGFLDPAEVKRQSTSPPTPNGIGLGGPCAEPVGCVEGLVGSACSGATAEDRDASCDSSSGAGDGFCDACVLTGGVTTEDEMFVLLGLYFVE